MLISQIYTKKSSKGLCILEDLMCGINGYFLLQEKFVQIKELMLFTRLHRFEFRAIGDYGKIANIKFVCGPLGGGESFA